jgi:hypothetical protein
MSLGVRLLRLAVVVVLSLAAGLALSVWISDWIGTPVAVFCLVYGSRIAWSGFDDEDHGA